MERCALPRALDRGLDAASLLRARARRPGACVSRYPEDWTTMRNALVNLARRSAARVVWAEQDQPRALQPYLKLRLLSTPSLVGQTSQSNERGVQVQAVIAGESYEIVIGIVIYAYVALPGDDATAIRDGLILVVNSTLPGTAHAVTDDALGLILAADDELETTDHALVLPKILQAYEGEAEFTLEVDGYAADDSTLVGMVDGLKLDLETSGAQELLSIAGLASSQVVGDRRLSALINGLWEYRRGFDLRMRCLAQRIEVIDYIEEVLDGGVSLTLTV